MDNGDEDSSGLRGARIRVTDAGLLEGSSVIRGESSNRATTVPRQERCQ
jgi:hypothetical protein